MAQHERCVMELDSTLRRMEDDQLVLSALQRVVRVKIFEPLQRPEIRQNTFC